MMIEEEGTFDPTFRCLPDAFEEGLDIPGIATCASVACLQLHRRTHVLQDRPPSTTRQDSPQDWLDIVIVGTAEGHLNFIAPRHLSSSSSTSSASTQSPSHSNQIIVKTIKIQVPSPTNTVSSSTSSTPPFPKMQCLAAVVLPDGKSVLILLCCASRHSKQACAVRSIIVKNFVQALVSENRVDLVGQPTEDVAGYISAAVDLPAGMWPIGLHPASHPSGGSKVVSFLLSMMHVSVRDSSDSVVSTPLGSSTSSGGAASSSGRFDKVLAVVQVELFAKQDDVFEDWLQSLSIDDETASPLHTHLFWEARDDNTLAPWAVTLLQQQAEFTTITALDFIHTSDAVNSGVVVLFGDARGEVRMLIPPGKSGSKLFLLRRFSGPISAVRFFSPRHANEATVPLTIRRAVSQQDLASDSRCAVILDSCGKAVIVWNLERILGRPADVVQPSSIRVSLIRDAASFVYTPVGDLTHGKDEESLPDGGSARLAYRAQGRLDHWYQQHRNPLAPSQSDELLKSHGVDQSGHDSVSSRHPPLMATSYSMSGSLVTAVNETFLLPSYSASSAAAVVSSPQSTGKTRSQKRQNPLVEGMGSTVRVLPRSGEEQVGVVLSQGPISVDICDADHDGWAELIITTLGRQVTSCRYNPETQEYAVAAVSVAPSHILFCKHVNFSPMNRAAGNMYETFGKQLLLCGVAHVVVSRPQQHRTKEAQQRHNALVILRALILDKFIAATAAAEEIETQDVET